jgi:hypothetical protein
VADWDADSPRLRQNLVGVLRDVRDRAARGDVPAVEDARRWQGDTMAGLKVPDKKYVGRFRGEPGLETTRVWVGGHEGAPPERVASELAAFEKTLQRAVAALDARYPRAEALDTDGLAGCHRSVRMGAYRVGSNPSVRQRKRPDGAPLG